MPRYHRVMNRVGPLIVIVVLSVCLAPNLVLDVLAGLGLIRHPRGGSTLRRCDYLGWGGFLALVILLYRQRRADSPNVTKEAIENAED